jgi:predicted nucleotidyltransferase/DNA-binding transcriptional ArsR family regulator
VWLRNPLDDILSSRAKVALLRVLMRTPSPLNGREIARRAGIDPGHASRQLRDLALSGVLRSRDQGRVVTYEISEDASGLVARLRDLFDAEAVRYRDSIQGLSEQIPEAASIVVFGSEARLEAKSGSDTDLLIVVPEHAADVERRAREACLAVAAKYSLAFSWTVMSVDELREMEETGNEFWNNVLRDGIRLHGKTLEALQRSWQDGKTTSRSPAGSGRRPRPSTTPST